MYRFLICVILSEIKNFKTILSGFFYFFSNVNFLKYFIYLFNNNVNPIKSEEFSKFIKLNKKKWIKFKENKFATTTKKIILVENFVNHPSYGLSNILIGKYLQLFSGHKFIGLLRKGDIKSEILFRSFGVDKFYYYKKWKFFESCEYIYKSIQILKNVKDIKKFCNIRVKKIDIGLTSYDTYIRYTRNPSSKKVNLKLILFFAEALFANDFFEKIFYNQNISKLVQSEQLYIPLSILFQKALIKKKEIYSRFGRHKICIRKYTSYSQRYEERSTFSKKLFNVVNKNYKAKSIKLINHYYEKEIRNKSYGKDLYKFTDDNINKNLKSVSKFKLCKIFDWDTKKRIATIFLHILIDGNCKYGKRNLFLDNYSWANHTLNIVKKIKNINWIIKQHPSEYQYNAKFKFSLLVKKLEKKYDHIRWYPENLNPASLREFTDLAITSHGTVGAEYPSFGIPCIVAENSSCSGYKFILQPKNVRGYEQLLKKANSIRRLKKKDMEDAKVFMFIFNILLKNNFSIMPDYILSRKIDEKELWHQLSRKLKDFNLKNDQFKKMLEKQLHQKFRHTVNFDLYSFKNKILKDY